MLAGSAASPFQPQQHLRNAVSARLRRLRCPNPNTSTGAGRRSSLTTFADARWFRRIPPGGLRWPCARCLGADDCDRTGGGCAGDLHDASQPRRWRRRRYAADRPFRRRAACRRSPTLSEGTAAAGFPDEIALRPEDYVFLKRRPSAFYGTGVAELLHMLRRDTIIIGGGATNRGVQTSVREAFNLDLASVVVRECCWSGDAAAHAYSLDKAMKMYARIRTFDQVSAMLRE